MIHKDMDWCPAVGVMLKERQRLGWISMIRKFDMQLYDVEEIQRSELIRSDLAESAQKDRELFSSDLEQLESF